ncbi:4406_t:CDS:2 [Paraglomus brasilianum]|uniref:4406_t:CDS:1 n=1 Tax=Paraglomus brasilianum TaxID=144538 RepID=A0A9N9CPN3_9GLOM|nr:4406_t:CDS:2 [Paraglomus brasilianum]
MDVEKGHAHVVTKTINDIYNLPQEKPLTADEKSYPVLNAILTLPSVNSRNYRLKEYEIFGSNVIPFIPFLDADNFRHGSCRLQSVWSRDYDGYNYPEIDHGNSLDGSWDWNLLLRSEQTPLTETPLIPTHSYLRRHRVSHELDKSPEEATAEVVAKTLEKSPLIDYEYLKIPTEAELIADIRRMIEGDGEDPTELHIAEGPVDLPRHIPRVRHTRGRGKNVLPSWKHLRRGRI